jgi:hypothetical protein
MMELDIVIMKNVKKKIVPIIIKIKKNKNIYFNMKANNIVKMVHYVSNYFKIFLVIFNKN